MGIKRFLLLTYTAGPGAAIPYGLSFMDLTTAFIVLCVCYIVPLPFMFLMLDRLNCEDRSRGRIMCRLHDISDYQIRVSRKIGENLVVRFNERWGGLGYYLSLVVLSFTFGFLWAGLLAYAMGFDKKRSYISIVVGTLSGIIFWTAFIKYSITILDPDLIMLVFVMIAIVFFIYGQFRERAALREIVMKLPKKAARKVREKVKRR
jgi:uncharacterized membrane protein